VRVVNLYGCTEAGNVAADCEAGQLHLSWDHILFEVLDETTWQPTPPGELGVAVLTTLTRQAQPLLRYVLGDFVRRLDDHDCSCGRTAPVLEHYGRDLNRFEFRGQRYFVRDLEQRLFAAPAAVLGDLWLLEVRPQEVRFRVEAARLDPVLYRRLQEQILEELGLPLVIDAVPIGALLSRERLAHVEPVGKPRMVSVRRETDSPLTLDELVLAR
jgi:phenylacetate-CoA ligase